MKIRSPWGHPPRSLAAHRYQWGWLTMIGGVDGMIMSGLLAKQEHSWPCWVLAVLSGWAAGLVIGDWLNG